MLKRILTVLVLAISLVTAFAAVAEASMGESGGIKPTLSMTSFSYFR